MVEKLLKNENSAKELIKSVFSGDFNQETIQAFSHWIIPALLEQPTENWNSLLNDWLQDLKSNKPIQYIFQKAFFGELELGVNEYTLIPRPETEELCLRIKDHYAANSTYEMLDIGTGSGCIPLLLKHYFPLWKISGCDIQDGAIEIAKQNAQTLELEVDFYTQNALEISSIPNNLNILVSNPPYISEFEKINIAENVLKFEPHIALFVKDKNPLIFYKKIAILAEQKIGALDIWLEINSELAAETAEIFKKIGATEIIIDYSGNPRFVFCSKQD